MVDLTDYEEGRKAIVAQMDYPEKPEERMDYLMRFINLAITEM